MRTNNLHKKLENIEEKINFKPRKSLCPKLVALIEKAEKALGFVSLPPLDPTKAYSQEELIEYYRRDY